MVSKHRLDKPCPCGSTKKYRDCCAPQNHRKKRRRRSSRRDSPPPEQTDSQQPEPPSGAAPPDPTPAFVNRVNAFIDRFADTFNATFQRLQKVTQGFIVDDTLQLLEMPPLGYDLDHAGLMLLHSWLLARRFDDLDVHINRNELVDELGGLDELDSAAADDALDVIDAARLGAWKVTVDDDTLTAHPVDGNPASEPVVVHGAVDNNWSDVAPGAIYVGWVADLGAGTLLFFAHELPIDAVHTLEDTAARGGWGTADNFRRRDYERDMLALAINPEAVDIGHDDGPLLVPFELAEDVDGFRNDMLRLICAQVFYERVPDWYGRYRYDLQLTDWTQRAARAIGEAFDELFEQLRHERDQAAYRLRDVPFAGPDTIAALIDDAELTGIAHLQPDGTVDHPTPQQHRHYPVGVLDLEPAWLRSHDISPDFTVDHALRRARTHLPEEPLQRFERAVEDHHIATRFAGIIALNRDADDAVIPHVPYGDLSSGIDNLLPRWVRETPVKDLADPGRGTWARITTALCDVGELAEDEPMQIADIPHHPDDMMVLPGVAEGTLRNIYLALYDYVATWPDSAGFQLPHPDPDAAEGRDDIAAGLDELDELF